MTNPVQYEIIETLPQVIEISDDASVDMIDGGEAISIKVNGAKIHLTHAQADALREALSLLPKRQQNPDDANPDDAPDHQLGLAVKVRLGMQRKG